MNLHSIMALLLQVGGLEHFLFFDSAGNNNPN